MLILTGCFFSGLSVTDEHSGLLGPVVNYLGTGESYSHTGKSSGEERKMLMSADLVFLTDLAIRGVCPDCSELAVTS